jgi:hypothetical protein
MARRIALIALIALQPRRQLRVQVFVDLIEQQNLTTSQSGDRRPDEREPGQQISDRASDGAAPRRSSMTLCAPSDAAVTAW